MRKTGVLATAALATVAVAIGGTSAHAGGISPASQSFSSAKPLSDYQSRSLTDVSAISASDVWAVGREIDDGGDQAFVQHWDGSSWTDVTIADPGPGEVQLTDVAAVSPSDVWVVGNTDQIPAPFVEHWDGSTWQVLDSPANQDRLWSVAASGPDDVWAVGDKWFGGMETRQPTVGHWVGDHWVDTKLEVPYVAPDHYLNWWFANSLTAISPTDAWVVGTYDIGDDRQPFIEHWNGSRWKLMPPLPDQSFIVYPNDASALGRNDVWVVGSRDTGGPRSPWAAHWDGHSWALQSWPLIAHHQYGLSGVTAIASDDVWAVGYNQKHVLAEHWDGHAWTADPTADPSRRFLAADLSSVDAVDAHHVIAVGQFHNPGLGVGDAYAERWNGTAWRRLH